MSRPGASGSAGAGVGGPGPDRRFDLWAADYDLSQLQTVLYGPVHDAALRYVRQHVPDPGAVLDVGCGTGRLPARLAEVCRQASVVGVDASTAMIRTAAAAPARHRARFAVCVAEQLAFADAVFDLVLVTLSVSHWSDQVAGLAELRRVMAPGAILVAAEVCAPWPFPAVTGWTWRSRSRRPGELAALICAGGLRVEHAEPVRCMAGIAGAVLVAASKPRLRQRRRRGGSVHAQGNN